MLGALIDAPDEAAVSDAATSGDARYVDAEATFCCIDIHEY